MAERWEKMAREKIQGGAYLQVFFMASIIRFDLFTKRGDRNVSHLRYETVVLIV